MTVTPAAIVIGPGDTVRLRVSVLGEGDSVLTDRAVAFTSRHSGIATVSGAGVIQAIDYGNTEVIAAAEGHADTTFVYIIRFTITDISAGGNHTCAATEEGGIACWGYNRYGQIGNERTGFPELEPRDVAGMASGVPVPGGNHTCALEAGRALCWGWNLSGQVGDGSPYQAIPSPVAVATDSLFIALTAGGQHTCGLTDSGVALCWGLNADGQIGDSTFVNQPTPVGVAGGLRFSTLSAGARHTCGVALDSLAYCWGANEFGQLGDGTETRRGVPTRVAGGLHVMAIAGGRFHTCALTGAGAAYCWGFNAQRQLGAFTPDSVALVPIAVEGTERFTRVSLGGLHSCALGAGAGTGTAFCWGSNVWGQIGDSSTLQAPSPTAVLSNVALTSIHTFGDHTCAMASTQRAYCWGLGLAGELGTGTVESSTFPVRVRGQRVP